MSLVVGVLVLLALAIALASWVERRITRAYWAGRHDERRHAPFRRRVHHGLGPGPQDYR